MTAIRNGVKTTLRTPGKTLLFSLILAALAVLICISFCVFAAVRNYIADCDEYYHTVVNVEFIGKNYPDLFTYDEALAEAVSEHRAELDALRGDPAVIRFEPVTHELAEVEGLSRTDRLIYDPDGAVLRVYVMGFDENGGSFLVSVTEQFYSRSNVDGKLIMMRTASMKTGNRPEMHIGESYVVCGHFFQSSSSYPSFLAEPLTVERDGAALTLPEKTLSDDLTTEVEEGYRTLAEHFRILNNSCSIQRTAAADDLLPFHQQELTLSEGRLFEPEEYASSAKVCIISSRIAYALDIISGDEIRLSLRSSEGDLYKGGTVGSDFDTYTVVGIYDRNDDYPATVFIPDASVSDSAIHASNGFRLGVFRIENTGITDFMAKAKELEQFGFRFTAYDQGYSSVVEPMSELMLISVIFLVICMALTAGALSLQCHIFITRQRDAAQTMFAMGSGKAHILLYFLSSAMLLAIPAAIVGCIIGKLTESAVFGVLKRFASQFAEQDLRFSSSRMTLIRTLEFTPRVSPAVYAAAGAALLFGVILFTLIFSRGVMKDRAVRKKRVRRVRTVKNVRRSTRLSGFLKYALLSIRRNLGRTAAVLLLCMLAALFFGRLISSLDGYRAQLDSVRESAVLKGHATDNFGRKLDGLVINCNKYDDLCEGEQLLSDIQISKTYGNLRFGGIPMTADGELHPVPEPEIPESAFAIETMVGQMYYEPTWVLTTSFSNSTIFYYAEPTSVEWFEGWDEEKFHEADPDSTPFGDAVCVMPKQIMDEYGISLGDGVYFTRSYEGWLSVLPLQVVGSYLTAAGDEVIFSPLDYERTARYSRRVTFDSLVFTLDDTSKLVELRDKLEETGFTPVRGTGGTRLFAVIDDEVYLDTTQSMERQIKYLSVLYTGLYILTGIVGFVLAWLLVSSRGKEMAVMRALGTPPSKITAIFFVEQLLLCGAGLGIGLLLRRVFGRAVTAQTLILTAIFYAVWIVSTLICLLVSVRKQAYAALAEPE